MSNVRQLTLTSAPDSRHALDIAINVQRLHITYYRSCITRHDIGERLL